jgi:hypothetical protein
MQAAGFARQPDATCRAPRGREFHVRWSAPDRHVAPIRRHQPRHAPRPFPPGPPAAPLRDNCETGVPPRQERGETVASQPDPARFQPRTVRAVPTPPHPHAAHGYWLPYSRGRQPRTVPKDLRGPALRMKAPSQRWAQGAVRRRREQGAGGGALPAAGMGATGCPATPSQREEEQRHPGRAPAMRPAPQDAAPATTRAGATEAWRGPHETPCAAPNFSLSSRSDRLQPLNGHWLQRLKL